MKQIEYAADGMSGVLSKSGVAARSILFRPPMSPNGHFALRARTVFSVRKKKRIRTENTVLDKSKGDLGRLLSEILDRARMRFSSVRDRGSARTGRRPRKRGRYSSKYPTTSANVAERTLRAPRANRDFGTDMKRIRTKITVMNKGKGGFGLASFRKIVA